MTMDRPHVVLDALLVGPEPTGVGRSILELAKAMSRQDRGLDFSVLVTHDEPFFFLKGVANWNLVPVPAAGGGSLRKALYTQLQLPRLCRRLGCDLLHSLQFVTPLRLSCPRVVTVHDLAWKSYAGLLQTSRRHYYDLMVPRSLRAAAAIVTNSESTAGDVRAFLPDIAVKVTTTPFGTPSWVWKMHEENGFPLADHDTRGRPYFLFVGTLEPRKNLERLLAAYEKFLEESLLHGRADAEIPDLLLAGARGWNDGVLQRQIRRLLGTGRLRVLDYCSPERLWGLYRNAVGLVFPSLHEGFGFPILEAMAAGCPVLTSGRGAMREVAGEAAVFVSPEDVGSICRGFHDLAWDDSDPEIRRALGFAQAKRWDWEATAASTCAVYRRVLSSFFDCPQAGLGIT